MKNPRRFAAAGLIAALAAGTVFATASAADEDPEFWQTPAINGSGRVHPLPKAAYLPDPKKHYRIVFAATKGAEKPTDISPALDRLARTVNLYASAGVPLSHLEFVAVLSGSTTEAVMDDVHYKTRFAVDNPNLPLIHKLRAAGVDVAVCGQAVAEHGIAYDAIAPDVTLSLSALTTITVLESRGYVLMPL